MKQHHLSTKFLVFYIFIGVFGFFLVTLGGSYMVEKGSKLLCADETCGYRMDPAEKEK